MTTHRRQDDPEEFDPGQMRKNGPWWSKGIGAVFTLGPLAVIALLLLANVLGLLPTSSKRNGEAFPGHQAIKQTLEAHQDQTAQMLRVLRAMCRHGAKSDLAKEDCDR